MATPGDFSFRTPDGSDPTFDMAWQDKDLGFTFRRSRLGLQVLCFPQPYQDLEITEGERLGQRKWERVQAALAALTPKKDS